MSVGRCEVRPSGLRGALIKGIRGRVGVLGDEYYDTHYSSIL